MTPQSKRFQISLGSLARIFGTMAFAFALMFAMAPQTFAEPFSAGIEITSDQPDP